MIEGYPHRGIDVPLAKKSSTGTLEQRLFSVFKVVLYALLVILEVLRLSANSRCCRFLCFVSLRIDLLAVWHGLGLNGNGQIIFSLSIIVCSINFVVFCSWELASPTMAHSRACHTAQQGQNKLYKTKSQVLCCLQAICQEYGADVCYLTPSEVFGAYTGESERRLREAFQTAVKGATDKALPTIIFLDEVCSQMIVNYMLHNFPNGWFLLC